MGLEGTRICLVDDEADVLEMLQDVLEDEGVEELVCCSTHEQACQALEAGSFDVAVLDIMGVDGLRILERFAAQLPCVMLTGHALSVEVLERAMTLGAKAYVPKTEVNALPRLLRIVCTAPPGFDLWSVWLHPGMDLLGLDARLGESFDGKVRKALLDRLPGRARGELIGEIIQHAGGVVEGVHRSPPLNLYDPATLQMWLRFLTRAEASDEVRAVVFSSGLAPGTPPAAVAALARSPALRWLGPRIGPAVAALLLRLLRPKLHRSVFHGSGMPLDAATDPALLTAVLEIGREAFSRIYSFRKPYLTAVAGGCVAGAFEKTLCAHFIVADENAAFCLPELRLGFTPPAGIALLTSRVGPQRAFAIAAETRLISGREAHRLGIVDRLVPVGEARKEAVKLARRFADHGTVQGLHLARRLTGFDLDEAIDVSFKAWRRMIETPFAQKRVAAFFRKRRAREKAGAAPR